VLFSGCEQSFDELRSERFPGTPTRIHVGIEVAIATECGVFRTTCRTPRGPEDRAVDRASARLGGPKAPGDLAKGAVIDGREVTVSDLGPSEFSYNRRRPDGEHRKRMTETLGRVRRPTKARLLVDAASALWSTHQGWLTQVPWQSRACPGARQSGMRARGIDHGTSGDRHP